MCSNYTPPKHLEIGAFSQTQIPLSFDFKAETWPGYSAPFLSNADTSEWSLGCFGMMPFWAKPALFRNTYNARTETVAIKNTYREAWKHRQLAIIPAASIFEPFYKDEKTKPVRWRIERADGKPMLIAGIWERWMDGPEEFRRSFSMLTINADEHPLMKLFHAPGHEKRSVVVLDDDEAEGWLKARTDADLAYFLRPFDPELMKAGADPLPPRPKKTAQPDA
jgi:putative SOS response-associated peptidase YedK